MQLLVAADAPTAWQTLLQCLLTGITNGSLFALIALGYTMVYGIVELINFAHGEVVMLGAMLALTLVGALGLDAETATTARLLLGLLATLIIVSLFCALLNLSIDRVVYRPLRSAPKLAPLVSAIGVSFVLMNVGLLWKDAADLHFPDLIPSQNLLGEDAHIRFTLKDAMVIATIVPLMVALTLFVKYTRTGTAMRATAQDVVASRLMGIHVDRVIGVTFFIGGALGGAASLIYGLYINTIGFQMGYQNGLYAFTAAVLGGIGSIPGAVLGGLTIGVVRALGSTYGDERWTGALIFVILIITLVFRPAGLLGRRVREKV